MTLTAADVAVPVAGYARRVHAAVGGYHHVASPLGAWLLLALCATASKGRDRQDLNATLGADCGEAADLAAALLSDPHPQIAAAAAAWHQGPPGQAERWLAALPPAVQTGPLPGQAELDDWARRHTSGLIGRFPLLADPALRLVAATVLATRVTWMTPFALAPAAALGPLSQWPGTLRQVLRTPGGLGLGHTQFVAGTAAAGDVAVHTGYAYAGGSMVSVTSVIALPGVPAGQVLAAAYDVATASATGRGVTRRSLFDLAVGDGPLWSVAERYATVTSASGREEKCTAVLPAWSALSEHNLAAPGLGFDVAMPALVPGLPWLAGQVAMARYTRTGFEAAAATVVAPAGPPPQPRDGVVRTAELRFGHPYAVVAVTADPAARQGPWHGLPVFSAWVTQAQDAQE